MKAFNLVKGNVEVSIRIYDDRAELVRRVDGNVSTSRPQMTPLEANREVNALLRAGYKNAEAARKAAAKK